MLKKISTPRFLAVSAMLAAIYAVLTIVLAPISYGNIQCRVSEALTLLPLVMPESIPGLFVGCLLANLYTGNIWDILFGSLATLLAACGTYALRKHRLAAAACPVVANGIIVGAMLSVCYGLPLWLTMLEVAVGEAAAVALGLLLMTVLERTGTLDKILKDR